MGLAAFRPLRAQQDMAANSSRVCLLFGAQGLGATVLGATSGWLIGLTGDSSQVPAAVVAGLLAALLGWLFLSSRRRRGYASVLAAFVVIVFCGAVFVAENITASIVANDAIIVLQDRRYILDVCSHIEFEVNRDRAMAGLPPLDYEFICGAL